jgi:hypothetical protein
MYTLKDFLRDYPDDISCLEEILRRKYSNWVCKCGRTKLYKVKSRPVYACACGKQINPLSDTPMASTKLPLTYWFFALYLMSQSKHGVSAAELQRHLGVKYKTAWRMCYQIRESMQDKTKFSGAVEVDETYVRAKPWRTTRPLAYNGRARTVIGLVERQGRARALVIPTNSRHFLTSTIRQNIVSGSDIYTDAFPAYTSIKKHYNHQTVNHSRGEWVRDNAHTQNVENLWSGVKLGLQTTHKGVSPQYLQSYLNFYSWSYSSRFGEPFSELLAKL